MLRFVPFIVFLLLTACQPTPRGEQDQRFYSYVDARGNLVTVERDADRPSEQGGASGSDQPQDKASGQKESMSKQEPAPRKDEDAGNKDFMKVRPENYQTPGQAEERMRDEVNEDEKDRFVSYRGPEGEIITRPLNMKAEREAAEQREQEREPEFERLPEGERYKESTSRVPADCCRHLTEGAPLLEVDSNFRLEFSTAPRVRLDTERPARILRLGSGVGALEVQSYIRDQGYLAPRLLMLDEKGMPVLKVNSLFTRHYSETWARYGYMDGWVERSPDFAYVVFYLPYARAGEQGLERAPEPADSAGEHRRALTGELAVTGRVQTRRGASGE